MPILSKSFHSPKPIEELHINTSPIRHSTIGYSVNKDMWVKVVFCKKKFWIYGYFKFLFFQTF